MDDLFAVSPTVVAVGTDRKSELKYFARIGTVAIIISSFFNMDYGCPRLYSDKTPLSKLYANYDPETNEFDYSPYHPRFARFLLQELQPTQFGCLASAEHADRYCRFFSNFRFLLDVFECPNSTVFAEDPEKFLKNHPRIREKIEISENRYFVQFMNDIGCTTHRTDTMPRISVLDGESNLCFHQPLPQALLDDYNRLRSKFSQHVHKVSHYAKLKNRARSDLSGLFHPRLLSDILLPAESYASLVTYRTCYCERMRHLVVDNHNLRQVF